MQETIHEYLQQAKIGPKQAYKNMAVFPLLSSRRAKADYLLLDEALEQKLIDITEVSEGGSVPELKFVNRGQKMVLLLDGEEVVGAKQNRIINTSILVAADSTTVIPVSCVEQGRWSYRRNDFISEDRIMASKMRAQKAEQVAQNVKMTGTYGSNQGEIWDSIEDCCIKFQVSSATSSMADVYENQKEDLDNYRKKFHQVDMQVGALFMINGRVAGLDSFGKQETFSAVFGKLVNSYVLDALDWNESDQEAPARQSDCTDFIEKVLSAPVESHKSVALGTDIRIESRSVTGFALTYDNEVLHLSAFARLDGPGSRVGHSEMQRFSARRRNRY